MINVIKNFTIQRVLHQSGNLKLQDEEYMMNVITHPNLVIIIFDE